MNQLELSILPMALSGAVKRHTRPGLLIARRGLGTRVDGVARDLVEAIKAAPSPGVLKVGLAGHATQLPGQQLTLRVLTQAGARHPIAVDVLLKAQGDDLYARFDVVAKVLVAYYTRLLYLLAFAVLWCGLYGLLLQRTSARYALGVAFAQKYFPNNAAAGVAVLVQGWDVNTENEAEILKQPTIENSFKRVRPWTLWDYASTDPALFVQSLASLPLILAAVVGGALMLVPSHVYRYPCIWLRWPAPEDFDAAIVAHKAWVERIFYDMLLERYGVSKLDVVEVALT